ncbi:hypothetical protein [Actinomadura sp. 21ATH]|uniref:hypothetical protein n=1 Tax=Actinomadura sp. 21ATH TaxID=1735444 RepID=UPI0035C21758
MSDLPELPDHMKLSTLGDGIYFVLDLREDERILSTFYARPQQRGWWRGRDRSGKVREVYVETGTEHPEVVVARRMLLLT